MIASVILWTNGLVTAFGPDGEQMPEYGGQLEDVKARIDAVFQGPWESGDWNTGYMGLLENEPMWVKEKRETMVRRIRQGDICTIKVIEVIYGHGPAKNIEEEESK